MDGIVVSASRSDVIPLRQIAGVQYDIDRKSRPAFAMRWDFMMVRCRGIVFQV